MKYFQTLPNISQTDFSGNQITVTNILARGYLLDTLQKNLYLYYDYTLKESYKPEIISYKFYNDQYRYWMIMYANNLFDVNSEWPLDYRNFVLHLADKYKEQSNAAHLDALSYTQDTIHHYEKLITTYNNVDNVKSTLTYQIDEDDYINTIESTNQFALNDGTIITKQVSKRPISIYDYEEGLNEKKRNIKLIKNGYANDMEKQLVSIMS